ncbi:MAG: hypothetical protein LBS81_01030 [Endomicrobium sp.]|jgi:hypothetical protein|nr:hypothetical protein [Endomicrobium sp.]
MKTGVVNGGYVTGSSIDASKNKINSDAQRADSWISKNIATNYKIFKNANLIDSAT